MAPNPPYFVYDAFDEDLDVGLLYKQLMKHNGFKYNMFQQLKELVWVYMSSHNMVNKKPYVEATVFDLTSVVDTKLYFLSLHQEVNITILSITMSTPINIADILEALMRQRETSYK